jgi:hypothetical protein
MATIKKLYYNSIYAQTAKEYNYDRETYIILNAYLDRRLHNRFITLFPQYKTQFNMITKMAKKIISHIINPTLINIDDDAYKAIINKFIANISKLYTITQTVECTKIITSYVIDPAHIDVFYNVFSVDA